MGRVRETLTMPHAGGPTKLHRVPHLRHVSAPPGLTRPRGPNKHAQPESQRPNYARMAEFGRRARLRIWWGNLWGFESPSSHAYTLALLAARAVGRGTMGS